MEIRVLAATGVLGAGFKVESLNRGIALKPTFIACDAGSTDSGPLISGPASPSCRARPVRAICGCCSKPVTH